ncbi:MAG: trans-aconitate 2-methyltransferase [Phycisphaerae bacterium]
MVTWNAEQYLKFADERSRPCRDLIGRIALRAPKDIVDLGCGPGNSTAALVQRWPEAEITGLDSSGEMIASARGAYPGRQWIEADISTWKATKPVDLIFSNAALQWVDRHEQLLPRLMGMLNPGGVMAVQMPANYHTAPAHRAMRELAAGGRWRDKFPSEVRRWHCHEPDFYYGVLRSVSHKLDIWTSEYIHILNGPEDIVQWYIGTGLRPYLEVLVESERKHFIAAYQKRITADYPRQPDGHVLFPFRRLFFIAYR